MIVVLSLLFTLFSFAEEGEKIMLVAPLDAFRVQKTVATVGEVASCEEVEDKEQGACSVVSVPADIAALMKEQVFKSNGQDVVAFEIPKPKPGDPPFKIQRNDDGSLNIGGTRYDVPEKFKFQVGPEIERNASKINEGFKLKAELLVSGSNKEELLTFGVNKLSKSSIDATGQAYMNRNMRPKGGSTYAGFQYKITTDKLLMKIFSSDK